MIKKDGGKAYSYIVDISNRWESEICGWPTKLDSRKTTLKGL